MAAIDRPAVMILRARVVVPVIRPPIEDGAVCISGERIVWAGPHAELPATFASNTEHDLGDSILLPGLINAHCHLDYTAMAGMITPPKSFADWIKAMVATKASWTLEDFATSWDRGAAMLLKNGTTTVADIEAIPELIPSAWQRTPLRVLSFRELLNVRSRVPAAELVERAVNDWLHVPNNDRRVGLSPHAPYTTTRELLETAARAAHRRGWRLTTHVAESEQEFQMYMYRQGPLFEWLKPQRDMSDCGHGSPVQHLERCGYLDENLLAVHVNYLWRHDAALLGLRQVNVVHCPQSHDYFQHLRFPRAELESAGVNLCLGTDSLATTRAQTGQPPELNLFDEMRHFSSKSPEVDPEKILRMVTTQAAKAIAWPGAIGEISEGSLADMIAIPVQGREKKVFEQIVHHRGPVAGSMISGRWVIAPQTAAH